MNTIGPEETRTTKCEVCGKDGPLYVKQITHPDGTSSESKWVKKPWMFFTTGYNRRLTCVCSDACADKVASLQKTQISTQPCPEALVCGNWSLRCKLLLGHEGPHEA